MGPVEGDVKALVVVTAGGAAVVAREAEESLRTPRLLPLAVPFP